MSAPIAFKSSTEYEAERQVKRAAREKHLEKVKNEYERNEKKKEQAKKQGDDTWMLASVSSRIDLESAKHKKKKKEKKKKHKKDKKHKKKKHKDECSSESDSDEPTWVENSQSTSIEATCSTPKDLTIAVKGPSMMPPDWKPQREEWMSAPMDLVPCVTRDELRARIKKDKKEKEEDLNLFDQPGQHARELNPFWKDGGTGMPEENKEKPAVPVLGDGGVSWLKKAYKRCVEQAEEEKRPLEEIAAERYGSLEKLETMIMEAEKNLEMKLQNERRERADRSRHRNSSRKYDEEQDVGSRRGSKDNDSRRRSRSRSKDRSSRKRRSHSRSRDKETTEQGRSRSGSMEKHSSRRRQSRSRSHDRHSMNRKRSRSRSKERSYSRNRRSRSRSKERESHRRQRSRSHSRECHSRRRSRSPRSERSERRSRSREKESVSKYRFMKPGDLDSPRERPRFMKPGESEDHDSPNSRKKSDSGGIKSRFRKPGGSDDDSELTSRYKTRNVEKDRVPAWKKRELVKPKEEQNTARDEQKQQSVRKGEKSDVRSDSEDSSSSSSESSEEELVPPVPILSEQEMNTLGAKIVKAELMGNEELAAKLKAQLEFARSARETHASKVTSGGEKRKQKVEEPEDVMLTTTTRSGVEMPLPERKTAREPSGGRRKKQKVATHGSSGQRERYFADDDKYDLKTMFQREKLGTAEDQDRMFARLAGKTMEKTDDDYQIDDAFVTRANKQLSESKEEDRQRADAIAQHTKRASAMDRCDLCLEKCPKHLIVAIGIRCYLCLPNCQSLTEGHCQIVPIQHVSCATSVDEDVWNEIQVFRKGLTKMFEEKDMDCAFMETVMGLKWQPHMVIDCVPMPKETGDMAPIYFKKAIQEAGTEWAQNKKLVDLRQKDIRRSVPKGFPYFSVDFGLEGGFAHVIEDEKTFPKYFGKEIIGGMLDLEPRLWRKPLKENFDTQRTKVLQLSKWWKPFDWTAQLNKQDNDDDD